MEKSEFGKEDKVVECLYQGTIVKIPVEIFFSEIFGPELVYEKKFLRYKDGAELYGISKNLFKEMAHEAGAVYKRNGMVLVKKDTFEEYLDGLRM